MFHSGIQKFEEIDHHKMIEELKEIVLLIQENMGLFSVKEREFVLRVSSNLIKGACSDKQALYLYKMRNQVLFRTGPKVIHIKSIDEEIEETLEFIRNQYKTKKSCFSDGDLMFLKSLQNGKIKENRSIKKLYEIRSKLL